MAESDLAVLHLNIAQMLPQYNVAKRIDLQRMPVRGRHSIAHCQHRRSEDQLIKGPNKHSDLK